MLQHKPSTEFEPIKLDEDFDSTLSGSFSKMDLKPEPLLKPNDKRFVLFPIQYPEVWRFYKHIESRFWTAEDIELGEDVAEFNEALNGKARSHIIQILCFLYQAQETTVNICNNFSHEIQIPEARCFIGFQNMQQNVHSELVSLLLDQVADQELREDTAALITTCSSTTSKEGWIQKYITDCKNTPFAARLSAFIVYLGVFSSSLAMIVFHLGKDRSEPVLPGFVHFMAKVKQDVDSFVIFYLSLLQKHVVTKVPDAMVAAMIREAASLECQVVSNLDEMSGGAGFVQMNADIKVEFEKVKMGVRARASEVSKWFGEGVSAIVGKPAIEDPMQWVNGVFMKERDRYAKHDAFVHAKNNVKKSAVESTVATLSFDADF